MIARSIDVSFVFPVRFSQVSHVLAFEHAVLHGGNGGVNVQSGSVGRGIVDVPRKTR